MHGLGHSPSFLVEGSWVIGFYRDSDQKQQPVILGTLPGVPQEVANFRKGFNDPRHPESTQLNDGDEKQYAYSPEDHNEYGPYPLGQLKDTSDETKGKYSRFSGHTTGEPDTSRLARGVYSETHGALVRRRKQKQTAIPISTKPNLKTVSDELKTDEKRSTWDEPEPKGIKSDASPYTSAKYPLNHVYESESGHVYEIDDTPSGERLYREHKSGTFEEIHPDGSMVTKIVKDNYEIVMGNENVYISGTVNLTIGGDCRQLIKGDYVLEVEGNYTEKIGKNHQVKGWV
jgi:Gp5 N-terminal OB domain.